MSKKKISKFTAELKTKVDSILIQKQLSANNRLRLYLESIADRSTEMEGIYHIVSLRNGYEDFCIDHIERNLNFIKHGNPYGGTEWRFIKAMKEYLDNPSFAINSSLVAIQLKGKINKTKINEVQITNDLVAKFNLGQEIAREISSNVKISFEKHETVTFKNDFQTVLLIRYFSSNKFKRLHRL